MKKIIALTLLFIMTISVIYIFQYQTERIDKSSMEYAKQNSLTLKAYEIERKKNHPRGKPYDRPDAAMQYEVELRSEIGKPFSYQPNWRFEAQKQAKRYSLLKSAGNGLQWVERGPGNIGGRSRAVVVHPQNPDIWWVAAVGGGIWQTTDSGENWYSQSDDLPVLSATTIDICTDNPAVLYAGTGEGFYNYDAVIGDGIFKTIDGGQLWLQLPSTASKNEFRYVNRVIVHPQDPEIVLAATNSGVYRSQNGGNSWQTVFSNGNRVQQIIANPLNFNTQFIAVHAGGIYKSTNMGESWQFVSEEIINFGRIELAISQADTSYLYATAAKTDGSLWGFYQSKDAGNKWSYLGSEPNWLRNQGWYDNTLSVDPFDPETVLVGGIDLYRIVVKNNTMSAQQLSSWFGGFGLELVHADQHFLTTIPTNVGNYAVIAVNDGGVYFSPNRGDSWFNKNNNYNVTQYYDGDRHPFRNQFIAGSQDNGTNLSPAGTIYSTKWAEVIGGDGFDCAWDKEDPNTIYGTLYDSQIYKSSDAGLSFRLLNDGDLPASNFFHTPLEMDPHNSQKLFTASGSNLLYLSEDGGESWRNVYVNLGDRRLIKIRVSQSDPSVVWAASSSEYINISTDGGKIFNLLSKPEDAPLASVTGLETHPADGASAFVTFGVSGFGKIFRTDDLGSSWQDITNNLPDVPVHCLLMMPYDLNEIWIGTDIGLFISNNGGSSWQYTENGLPAAAIRRLKIVGQEIVAVTHGRGIWSVFNEQLPEVEIPLRNPILAELNPPDPNLDRLKIKFMARGNYDSLLVKINDKTVRVLENVTAYQDTFVYYNTSAPADLLVRISGFKDGLAYDSEQKTVRYLPNINGLIETFDQQPSDFSGDFIISREDGFGSQTMHTEHIYNNKRQYISVLETPIEIFEDSRLSYRDVALVEPGEEGKFYPEIQMWDYVTVEGSKDGENWHLLIEPYDCRAQTIWQTAYTNNFPGDSSMFVRHEIDLTAFYDMHDKIYIRFRLFADDYTTGWGWAIDDIEVSTIYFTDIKSEPGLVSEFKLLGNYPNPFNPATTIQFTLAERSTIKLQIFNNLGQLVKTIYNDKDFNPGVVHHAIWDGTTESGLAVASGTYYYRLESGSYQAVGKMVLLR